MDPNKLYVANVPADTTQEALRCHFSARAPRRASGVKEALAR